MNRLTCLILVFVFSTLNSFGQQFGGNPPSLKWNQINTDSVRVIFPVGQEKKANEIASIVQSLGRNNPNSLGKRQKRISIVLQNQSTISNAYVGLGPWRSEFQLTPQQNSFELGSIPWHQTLSLHEYRHVHQFNNFKKGISQLFYILAGEYGLSFANNAAIPNWFWEGDAVYQETFMSEQGRGRMPYFFNGYRSLWASNRNYSWLKLRNGSLRDYVPDHYQLGYLLTAYGYEKYGKDFWGNVTDDAARFNGLFYPFQHAIKNHAGIKYKEFRKNAINYFQEQQKADASKNKTAVFASQHKHFNADEEYPQWINESSIVFVNSSFKKIPAFTIRNIDDGKEKKIRVKDISLDNYFSYRNNLIVYSAFRPDSRWGWREFGEIRLLNLLTNEQKTLTQRSRYFAPDIDAKGEEVVAVNNKRDGASTLAIINAATGALIRELPNKDEFIYTYPKFFQQDFIISPVRNNNSEMALIKIDRKDGSYSIIIPFSLNVIGFPQTNGDTISFTMSQAGFDKLYSYVNGKVYEFTPEKETQSTGNYQLSILGNKYAWTSFSSAGYYLQTETNPTLIELQVEELTRSPTGFKVSYPENSKFLDTFPSREFPVTRYKKSFKLFNFHSWIPTIDDPEYTFSFLGENVLNTMQSELYFRYNTNEKSKQVGFIADYAAWFPWLRVGAGYTFDRSAPYRGNTVYWNEAEGSVGFLVPLNLTNGKFFQSLQFGSDFVYSKPSFQQPFKDTFDDSGFGYVKANLFYSIQIQRARQHIFPRFAQTLQVTYNNAFVSAKGYQATASTSLYLPGVYPTHNFVINAAIHGRDTLGEVRFSNIFPFSRGYNGFNFHQMAKFGFNYHIPLIYPDWGFASIVYFLRIRANAFYDQTRIMDYNNLSEEVTLDFRSYGAEIYFDTKWWNQHPVSFGFRYSRLLDGDILGLAPNQWEFILPINLVAR